VLLAAGLSLCFFLAWLASAIGLASIVGAFAAGLILESAHYGEFVRRGEHGLEDLVHPIASFLVPVFFVLMGMRTDVAAFAHATVLGLAAALTLAAIVGKQACGLGAVGQGLDGVSIGIDMIPRGEVGLIFANIGLGLELAGHRIVSPAVYSAIVVMVVLTTLVTPPALRWSLRRAERASRKPAGH
jgi:Kef-type K+ transport system membrane component KefB